MLRALMLRKKLDGIEAALAELRAVDFDSREAELIDSIEEAQTDEERAVVDEAIEKFEAERKANADAIAEKEGEAEAIRSELAEIEERQKAAVQDEPVEPEKEVRAMPELVIRDTKYEALRQMAGRDDVKDFIENVRSAMKTRSIANGNLLIPEVLLPMIVEMADAQSKMLPVVNAIDVRGKSRITVAGAYPEAVWTEMCADINELALGFAQTTVDGYKLAGYIPVCNALLEDNDVNLLQYVMKALAVAIAKGTDAGILYGTGTNMPLGILPRLAQTAKPEGYTGVEWEDLHTSHLLKTNATGAGLFKAIFAAMATTVGNYASGEPFYAMNRQTEYKLRGEAVGFNSANDAVAGSISGVLGNIVTCDLIPVNDIVMGFGGGYTYARRAGIAIDMSEHAQFIQDNTVFRAKTRGDGKPAIASNFAAINIANENVATTRTWPGDAGSSSSGA